MPDSPSIPATGWNGLPKRKARPLLVQVSRDRLRPASSSNWRAIPRSRHSKQRLLILATLIIACTTLVLLFTLSYHSDRVQLQRNVYAQREVLFQDDVDSDSGSLLNDDFESDSQDSLAASTDEKQLGTPRVPFSCPAYLSNGTVAAKYASAPGLLRRSILHAGSGQDVGRVLERAATMSKTWAATQQASDVGEAFRVMVIGGSVSNCRGVDRSLCWHSHLLRWLSSTFPLGDSSDKLQVSYRFIDLAKSATGSTFFSYCWHSELVLRKKQSPHYWGIGPDLVIIETGVNDVVSPSDFISKKTTQSYPADFQSLLSQLKNLPSRPAVVVLEAPSRLLQETQGLYKAAEFTMHLAPSIWLDVPVISGKTALLTPQAQKETEGFGDIYLADGHHPNARGHEVLADLLIAHLEELVCRPKEEVETLPGNEQLDSLHKSSAAFDSVDHLINSSGQCIQVGAGGEKQKPRKNRGWNRLATSRDKQYMASSTPGSRLVYEVDVGNGGQILLSWLNSRFYNLGEARVILDDQKPGVKISGHWQLPWSIGVPTVLFENVTAGVHTISIEHARDKPKILGASAASSNFRLIALATT